MALGKFISAQPRRISTRDRIHSRLSRHGEDFVSPFLRDGNRSGVTICRSEHVLWRSCFVKFHRYISCCWFSSRLSISYTKRCAPSESIGQKFRSGQWIFRDFELVSIVRRLLRERRMKKMHSITSTEGFVRREQLIFLRIQGGSKKYSYATL